MTSPMYSIALQVLRTDIGTIIFRTTPSNYPSIANFMYAVLMYDFSIQLQPGILENNYAIYNNASSDELMIWANAYVQNLSTSGSSVIPPIVTQTPPKPALTSNVLAQIRTRLAPYLQVRAVTTSDADREAKLRTVFAPATFLPRLENLKVVYDTIAEIFFSDTSTNAPKVEPNTDNIMVFWEKMTIKFIAKQIGVFTGGANTNFQTFKYAMEGPLYDLNNTLNNMLPTFFSQQPPADLAEYFNVTYSVILSWWLKYYNALSVTVFRESDVLLSIIFFTTPLTVMRYIASFAPRDAYKTYTRKNSFYDVMYAEYAVQIAFQDLVSLLIDATKFPESNFTAATCPKTKIETLYGDITTAINQKHLNMGSTDRFYDTFKRVAKKSEQNQTASDNLNDVSTNFEWRRSNLGIMLNNTTNMEQRMKHALYLLYVWGLTAGLMLLVSVGLLLFNRESYFLMYSGIVLLVLVVVTMINGMVNLYRSMY